MLAFGAGDPGSNPGGTTIIYDDYICNHMAKYTIAMERDEEGMGIKSILFEVPQDMYALIGDILTGKIVVQPPAQPAEARAVPAEEQPSAPAGE